MSSKGGPGFTFSLPVTWLAPCWLWNKQAGT